jgi:hypothetical protein
MTEIFKGMRIEIDGRQGTIRHLTPDRCWVLYDGDLIATGLSPRRVRRLLAETQEKGE